MNIIQAIFALALMGMVVAGGIQYVNPSAMAKSRVASQADSGFSVLEGAYRSRQASGAAAPAADGWQAALFPVFGTMPAAVSGLSWSYGVQVEGNWFCLSGPLSGASAGDPVMGALTFLATRRPEGLYEVTRSCGGVGGEPAGTVAATLWMQRAAR
ncbi:hypothetical protein J2848_006542 [Azospirillum lipoferum]|uniref:Uncharacterized protein n=1 Tax=Azospirillum lipoferum TaxID=193 RepID=A0A5A9GDT1_AZOLI|nr:MULTISPECIES: hypothetical protein [Azospirillum]KAA0591772.1 hypothetical protein FZ942_30830 [Azospirillum lipoferum]MCP1614833.1 hypothetical protein [Azospirillum lipoferum]MDW5536416.1 hypothetical protein [Azospirillum sp. NL1]